MLAVHHIYIYAQEWYLKKKGGRGGHAVLGEAATCTDVSKQPVFGTKMVACVIPPASPDTQPGSTFVGGSVYNPPGCVLAKIGGGVTV